MNERRKEARLNKDFKTSDEIREALSEPIRIVVDAVKGHDDRDMTSLPDENINYLDNINNEILSLDQCLIPGSSKGTFVLSYIKNGKTEYIKSDSFVNESVRVFNLICKITKRSHLYDFKSMDIVIEREKKTGKLLKLTCYE